MLLGFSNWFIIGTSFGLLSSKHPFHIHFSQSLCRFPPEAGHRTCLSLKNCWWCRSVPQPLGVRYIPAGVVFLHLHHTWCSHQPHLEARDGSAATTWAGSSQPSWFPLHLISRFQMQPAETLTSNLWLSQGLCSPRCERSSTANKITMPLILHLQLRVTKSRDDKSTQLQIACRNMTFSPSFITQKTEESTQSNYVIFVFT